MKTGYFILGMHRSGTSALGGVLDIIGLEFGSNLMPPHEENPKGYFENNFVVALNEKILNENDSSWDDESFDMNMLSKESIKKYIEEAKEIIGSEFKYAQKFVIKDPRICLLFPIWEMACKELNIEIKTILPYRNPMEVATSLQKRNNFSIEKGLLLWIKHFLSAEYFSRKYERIFISFDNLLDETEKSLDELYIFTDFNTHKKQTEIYKFLDKNIKHNNIAIENFTKEIPRFFQELLDILQTKEFDNLDLFDIIRNDYIYSQKLFQDNHNKELKTLMEKVHLLEQIKDIAVFDEEYYLKAYPDLSQYNDTPFHHYLNYGKTEKRNPNEYCEIFNIDTQEIVARDEENYALNEQLQNVQNINIKQSSTIESQENKINELKSEIHVAKEEKVQIEHEYESKLHVAKEEKVQIEQKYKNKEQEIKKLNLLIDDIIKDLLIIKESKCWLYTKPLRDAQKILKR